MQERFRSYSDKDLLSEKVVPLCERGESDPGDSWPLGNFSRLSSRY